MPTRFSVVDQGTVCKPDVLLVRIDGSRHFIMYDQPETFDAAVEGFLKQGR